MIRKLFRRFLRRKIRTRNARRFKRFRADFLVKYHVDRKGEAHVTNARDISAGGVRFWSDQPIPESSVVNVSIFVPPLGRAVDALAQVRRVTRVRKGLTFSVAVSFIDLKQEDREALSQFAENLSKEKGAELLIDHADIVVRRSGS